VEARGGRTLKSLCPGTGESQTDLTVTVPQLFHCSRTWERGEGGRKRFVKLSKEGKIRGKVEPEPKKIKSQEVSYYGNEGGFRLCNDLAGSAEGVYSQVISYFK